MSPSWALQSSQDPADICRHIDDLQIPPTILMAWLQRIGMTTDALTDEGCCEGHKGCFAHADGHAADQKCPEACTGVTFSCALLLVWLDDQQQKLCSALACGIMTLSDRASWVRKRVCLAIDFSLFEHSQFETTEVHSDGYASAVICCIPEACCPSQSWCQEKGACSDIASLPDAHIDQKGCDQTVR